MCDGGDQEHDSHLLLKSDSVVDLCPHILKHSHTVWLFRKSSHVNPTGLKLEEVAEVNIKVWMSDAEA